MSVRGRSRSRSTNPYVQIGKFKTESQTKDEISDEEMPQEIADQPARKGQPLLTVTVFKPCLRLIHNITVEPIMFFFIFSKYLYLSLIELYFYQKFGLQALNDANSSVTDSSLLPNHSFCVNSSLLDDVLGNGTNDKVEGDALFLILMTYVSDDLTSILACLIAGPLSDRYGRKPAILFALLGNLLAAIVNVLLVYFNVSEYYFVGSSLLMGVTGGFTIVMTVSLAYVADVSSKRSLTFRIGILHAVSYTCRALADILTGQWLKRSGCNFNPVVWMDSIII